MPGTPILSMGVPLFQLVIDDPEIMGDLVQKLGHSDSRCRDVRPVRAKKIVDLIQHETPPALNLQNI